MVEKALCLMDPTTTKTQVLPTRARGAPKILCQGGGDIGGGIATTAGGLSEADGAFITSADMDEVLKGD